MANEPTAVLLNDRTYKGEHPAKLTHSIEQLALPDGDLSNSHSVTVQGLAGSTVTFFDNNTYQESENYLMIIKVTDADITLDLADNNAYAGGENTSVEVGDRVYSGEKSGEYQYFLYKVVKKTIFQEILGDAEHFLESIPVVGDIATNVFNTLDALLKAYLNEAEIVWNATPFGKYFDLGVLAGTSNNYHVDNVSSIRFGVGNTGL